MTDAIPTNGTKARLDAIDRRIDDVHSDTQTLFRGQSDASERLVAVETTLTTLKENVGEMRKEVAALPGIVWKSVAAVGVLCSIVLGVLSFVLSQFPG